MLFQLPHDVLNSIFFQLGHRDVLRLGMTCKEGRGLHSNHYFPQLKKSVSYFIAKQRGAVSKSLYLSVPFILFKAGGLYTVLPEVVLEVLSKGFETVILDVLTWESREERREREREEREEGKLPSFRIGDNTSTANLFCVCAAMSQNFMVKSLMQTKSFLNMLSVTKKVLPRCNITFFSSSMNMSIPVVSPGTRTTHALPPNPEGDAG